MQNKSAQHSYLRQQLIQLAQAGMPKVDAFLSNRPLIRGTLYVLRRKCSKPSCRCTRGLLHQSTVLTASVSGKTRLWTIPDERISEVRSGTEAYRHFKRARAAFLKQCREHQNKALKIIDEIERIRTYKL